MAQQISAFPPVPLLTDTPEEFDPKAVTFNLFLANTFVGEANALSTEVETNASTAETKAAEAMASAELSEEWATSLTEVSGGLKGARGYAQDAQEYADNIAGAVNFKGAWSSLTGSLNVPASVFHNDQYWQLLNNLVDVTLSEPGVSADWASITSSTIWTPISTSQTLDANTYYAVDFTGGPLTLTLPAAPDANDFMQFYTSAGDATDSIIARNGSTIMGLAEDLALDYDAKALHLVCNGTDWRVVR